MWLSAIHRDLPKVVDFGTTVTGDPHTDPVRVNVGLARFDRMEEGQFVVMDNADNEFMLFHPEVDTSEIKEGVWLASWEDQETKKWMWAIATCTAPNCFTISENAYVEPKPH